MKRLYHLHMKYTIKIQPNANENKIVEEKDDFLKIKIHAIPEHGKANDELIKFLSKHFKIPKSNIGIIKGKTSKNKIVEII
ncbi:MAG: DUF167 domain-containing protein [Patescibacteria group bacterium]|nr:DUF167 domain-containing protein [Patescibacteria group bacterium]